MSKLLISVGLLLTMVLGCNATFFYEHETTLRKDGIIIRKLVTLDCICDGLTNNSFINHINLDIVIQNLQHPELCGIKCQILSKCHYCALRNVSCIEFSNRNGNCSIELSLTVNGALPLEHFQRNDTIDSKFSVTDDGVSSLELSSENNTTDGFIPIEQVSPNYSTRTNTSPGAPPIRSAREDLTNTSKNACTYPTNLPNSVMDCMRQTEFISCRQKCVFGYTLAEGISRNMYCSFEEGKWHPKGFEDCLPFLDCTVALVLPGYLHCDSPFINLPKSCYVECDAFEKFEETYGVQHHCTIEGLWEPELPFCVVNGSNLILAERPRHVYHPNDYVKQSLQRKPKGPRRRKQN